MSEIAIISDQFNNGSDKNEITNHSLSSTQTQGTAETAAAAGCHPSRVDHRALQALRKTRVQMCPGSRAWAEVLPFSKQAGRQTRDGLHPPGLPRTGGPVLVQPSPCTSDSGRNLRNQPGAHTTQTEAVGGAFGGSAVRTSLPPRRCHSRRSPVGKHGGLTGRRRLCCGGDE